MPGPRGNILTRTTERMLLLHEGNIAEDEDLNSKQMSLSWRTLTVIGDEDIGDSLTHVAVMRQRRLGSAAPPAPSHLAWDIIFLIIRIC
jgi:hypothetical protein